MATTKISELNPLASGSTCAAAVLPIVNDGTTDKISIDNLRGTLRGASNQGPANAALNGGINNAACRLGDSALGGQNNIVNANFCTQTSNSNYYYVGPVVASSGSLSTMIGGLYNKIDVKSALNNSGYAITPDMIIGAVSSCITGSATSAYGGYYGIVGGNTILGGHSQRISGPTANGNYSMGHAMILGGYANTISAEDSQLDGVIGNYNNAIINSWFSEICRGTNSGTGYLSSNTIIGGGSNKIQKNSCLYSTGVFNNIIGGVSNCVIDSCYSTIVSDSGKIQGHSHATIIGGDGHQISGSFNVNQSLTGKFNSIIGGKNNCLLTEEDQNTMIGGVNNSISGSLCNTVVLGGLYVTASVNNAVHLNQLVFKTGASGIPTSNPGVAGQVWNDAGTLKIS